MSARPLATAFIVDDDVDMRGSLEFLIKSAGIPTCSYASAREFLAEFDPCQPGCLVCDVRMPEMTGLELLERLNAMRSPLPVILMTAYADVPMAVRALKLGAAEFVEKPFSPQMLLERIQHALIEDNGRRVSHEIWNVFSQRMSELSEKERTTLTLIITGAPNKAIAARLEMSERAIEERRASIMKKLNVNSLAELVRQVTTFELLFPHQRLTRLAFDELQES